MVDRHKAAQIYPHNLKAIAEGDLQATLHTDMHLGSTAAFSLQHDMQKAVPLCNNLPE